MGDDRLELGNAAAPSVRRYPLTVLVGGCVGERTTVNGRLLWEGNPTMQSPHNHKGFTLIEVLVAIVILSVSLLGTAALTASIIRGNAFSSRMTAATILGQEKMEEMRRLGYSHTPASGTTVTEDYGSIPDCPAYKRVTVVDVGIPAAEMKMVTVTVYWNSDAHSASLKTILAE